jgi:hypothetical protein
LAVGRRRETGVEEPLDIEARKALHFGDPAERLDER